MSKIEARENEGVLKDVSRELYDFLVETIEGLGLGTVSRGFEELTKEEMAVFKVKSRLIISRVVGGWR